MPGGKVSPGRGAAVSDQPAVCLICGAPDPPGHVMVRDDSGGEDGRVCSWHRLIEVLRADLMVTLERLL